LITAEIMKAIKIDTDTSEVKFVNLHNNPKSGDIYYGIGNVFTYHEDEKQGLQFLIEEECKNLNRQIEELKQRVEIIKKATV